VSTFIQAVIDDAAVAIGDPNKQRVSMVNWTSFYNRSNRELCAKANILRFNDKFDLIAGQRKYAYPQRMTVMTGLRVSETPSDENSFKVVHEIFEDEFREKTDRLYPTETLPSEYFATSSWWQPVGTATAQIVDGGCITYYGLPDRITLTQIEASQVLQIPDFAQDYLLQRMIIYGMRARNRYAEAKAELDLWYTDMATLQDKLDDRSQDRRSTLAPRKNRFAGMR
jgi:hypothetical protein